MKAYIDEIVIAQPNYCVPAVLEMVIKHFGYMKYSQNEIASKLNILPADDKIDHRLWGAQIKNDTLNNFFSQSGIQLHERFISINQFMDEYFMGEEIAKLLSCGVSIICGYNYTWLFGNREDSFGHVSIIVDVSENREAIELLDPGPKNAGYKSVSSSRLFAAIRARKDGLWCISEILGNL